MVKVTFCSTMTLPGAVALPENVQSEATVQFPDTGGLQEGEGVMVNVAWDTLPVTSAPANSALVRAGVTAASVSKVAWVLEVAAIALKRMVASTKLLLASVPVVVPFPPENPMRPAPGNT